MRALTWTNVDLKNGLLTVAASATHHGKELKSPKTEAGYREVPMPEWLTKLFTTYPKGDSGYLYTHDTPDDGHSRGEN